MERRVHAYMHKKRLYNLAPEGLTVYISAFSIDITSGVSVYLRFEFSLLN